MTTTKKVPIELSGQRLDKASAELFSDFSRTQIKKWIVDGRILVNGDLGQPKESVQEDDEIEINPIEERKVSWDAQDIPFGIFHETEDFIIIDKPAGLVMHPGSGCFDGTLANGLINKFPELANLPRSGIVHRLDKGTSGILLVARNDQFRNYFINEMHERRITKKYTAIVSGSTIGSFPIEAAIGRDKNNRTKMCIRLDGKEAITFVKLKEKIGNYSVLDVTIETGRTHQIRVHLASKKLPIIGDRTYDAGKTIAKGSSKELIAVIRGFSRTALHARLLSFVCNKSGEELSFEIPTPSDMQNLVVDIKNYT
jgi:23S rRNA pseudouridine1911/1915/1917 synthase